MARNRSRDLAPSFVETLEARQLLSHTVFVTRLKLTATVSNGVIGQSMTIPASAKLTAAGSPLRTATIDFVEDGTTLIGEAQTGRSGYASVVLPNFYIGKHELTAYFVGSERYVKSQSASYTATITAPSTHTTTADGIEESTIIAGSGTELEPGDTVPADYNAYLQANGMPFDTTAGKTPLTFEDGDPGLAQGFNEGVEGMQVGEVREIVIPWELGYGAKGTTNVPPKADLVFVVRLD
jgi:hypothetical protein